MTTNGNDDNLEEITADDNANDDIIQSIVETFMDESSVGIDDDSGTNHISTEGNMILKYWTTVIMTKKTITQRML